MSRSLASKSIGGRSGIGRRQIATAYLKAKAVPLPLAAKKFSSASGIITTTWQPGIQGTALIFIVGSGGCGPSGGNGGGGGSALFAAVSLQGNEIFSVTTSQNVGTAQADGSDTIVQVGGRMLVAGGGKGSGVGGIATGGDINRTGGAGGSAANQAGTAGQFGGSGGAGSASGGGGGGCAGFTDMLGDLYTLTSHGEQFVVQGSAGAAPLGRTDSGGTPGTTGGGTCGGFAGGGAVSIIIIAGNYG
jgi:hypothetical protein